jgi:hypothetical protein
VVGDRGIGLEEDGAELGSREEIIWWEVGPTFRRPVLERR